MWALCDLCRKKKRGSIGGNSKAFDTFVVEGWNEGLSKRSVCYIIKKEKIMRKCTCICVWF
jgi:hypothetical protein